MRLIFAEIKNNVRLCGTDPFTSVTNVFNAQGLLAQTYGSRNYPVGYGYDAQGRMKYMTNWSDFTGNNGARVTTWNYDPYRGFLTGKSYDNGNSAGPSYSYSAGGRLLSRVWARGITTSYSYNPAGQLSAVTYSDGTTPGTSYGYDRRGRQTSITNGSSICTLTLNDAGKVLVESYSGTGPLSGISLTNGYDALLRRTRNTTLVGGNLLASTAETYDAASRPLSFSDGINSAAYGYVANSPLVGQISFSNYGALKMVTTKLYDNLNRLTLISSANALSPVLDSHAYAYNSANQRTAVTNSDGCYWIYQYDNLGQVTSGVKYWSDGTPVAGQQFGYGFDSIGNRQSTATGGDQTGAGLRPASYGANNLNQYTNRTVPNAADIIGSATNAATVTVNGQASYRHNDYYRTELGIDNSAGPVFQAVSNVAVLTLDTNVVSTNIIGNVFLPQSPENYTYDADGNLVSEGRWTYVWDGENRLVCLTNNANVPDAAKMTLNFAYDYLGRRISKTVARYNSSTSSYQTALWNTFVYDGWNLQAELNATNNALIRSYVWGLDLSGSEQGAGGVGGLLWTFQPDLGNARAFACFDGNGNVSALAYCSNASVIAQYEYGPFGEVLRATGPMAKANPFRFSTKYQDDDSDLVYYGYRYYCASIGRWANRDPMGETGLPNLYGFLRNAPLGKFDALGLFDGEVTRCMLPRDFTVPYVPAKPPEDPPVVHGGFDMWAQYFQGSGSQNYALDANALIDVLQTYEVSHFKENLLAAARSKWRCNSSGSFGSKPEVFAHFWPASDARSTIGGFPGMSRWLDWAMAGNFQLTLGGTCTWKCGVCQLKDGKCVCSCATTCKIDGMVSKYFTFAYVPGGNPGNILGSVFPAILPTSDFTVQGSISDIALECGTKSCGKR